MQAFKVADSIVCINNTPLQGSVYVSLTFGIGFASRKIRVQEQEKFIGASTANVYFNYIKTLIKQKYHLEIGSSVSMNSSSLYWKSTEEDYVTEIQNVLDELFTDVIDETLFAQEKKNTIARFKNHYKNLEFRGRLKIMEFTHKNKDYSFEDLTQDLLNVTDNDVQTMRKYLLTPRNSFLFLHGPANKDAVRKITLPKIKSKQIQYLFGIEDYHFLQDEAFITKSKNDYQCGSIKFERGPTFEHISKEYAVLTLIGEMLFKGYYSIEVDHMDASIIYYEIPLRSYKHDVLNIIDRDNVDKAKIRFLKRFDQFIGQQPHAFVEMAGRLHFDKINIYEWYENIKELNAQEIQEFIQVRNYKIREGYIHYYKEENEYGII